MGDQWLAQQKRIQDAKNYSYGKMAQANLSADQHKQIKEYVDYKYDPTGEFSKPFRQTELYQGAKEVAHSKDTTAQRNTIDLLNNTVKSVEKIGSPDDSPEEIKQKKAAQIKTFLTSLVNSAKGSADAEQANEVLRRSPEIFTFPEMQALRNRGALDATGLMAFLSSREGASLKEKIANSLSADPDAYIQKVKVIHDDLAKSWNERMKDQVIRPTNPQTAKELGIIERPLILTAQPAPDVVVTKPSQQTTQAVPQMTRQQMAADILRQRAAQKALPQPVPAQQDLTGKSSF